MWPFWASVPIPARSQLSLPVKIFSLFSSVIECIQFLKVYAVVKNASNKFSYSILKLIIIPLFTLGSIYSSNACGAEKMPETNNSVKLILTGLRIPTDRRQTVVEDLNSGPPNCKSRVLTTRQRCLVDCSTQLRKLHPSGSPCPADDRL